MSYVIPCSKCGVYFTKFSNKSPNTKCYECSETALKRRNIHVQNKSNRSKLDDKINEMLEEYDIFIEQFKIKMERESQMIIEEYRKSVEHYFTNNNSQL